MNNISIYQILVFSISIYAFLRVVFRYMNGERTFREVFLSFLIWGGFSLLGLFPNVSVYVAKWFGFELGINFLLVSAVLILFYAMLKQSIKNDDIENTITHMVRNHALESLDLKRKEKKKNG